MSSPASSPEELFETDRKKFLEMRPALLRTPQYVDKYVAVVDGEVVDSDQDKVKLAKRIYSRRGYIPMYIGKVSKEERYCELPSPEKRDFDPANDNTYELSH